MPEDGTGPSGPLDVATLRLLGERAASHPLVNGWQFRPDAISPRVLELQVATEQFPAAVTDCRLDVRWFERGDYSVHYLETSGDGTWQCRWDRHPKASAPGAHFHPPPDAASSAAEPSALDGSHPLDVLFAVLDWVESRVEEHYD